MGAWLNAFAHDTKSHILLALFVVDFILGVSAAVFVTKSFRMSYVADILRRDVLGKLVPYFGLYALALIAGNEEFVPIPGADFGLLAGLAFSIFLLAMVGSILNSLHELVPSLPIPAFIAGDELPAPTGDVPVTMPVKGVNQ